jgi:hypothetical protein
MALKKKPAAKSSQAEVSKSDFIKKLSKSKTVLKEARSKTAPSGYTTDEDVIKGFELRPGSGKTARCRLTSAKVVDVNDSPVVKFKFVVQDGPNKGMVLQNDVWMSGTDEQMERSFESIVFLLQKLGYATDDIEIGDLYDLLSELTEEKPFCIVYLNCYKVQNGKNKGKLKYGLRVNSAYEPSEESEDEDDDEDEEPSEEDDEEDSEDEDDGPGEDEESDGDDEEEDDEEGDDDSGEPDEDDPSTWVDFAVKCKPPKAKKAFVATVTKYTKKGNKLTVSTKDGTEYVISPDDVEDWA